MASVKVCKPEELAPGMATRVVLDGTPVAVFNVGGEFYAVGDTCSHEQASLSEGEVEDGIVECPKHGATFDLKSGANLTLPATRPVPTFVVLVQDGELYVEASA